MAFIAGKLFFCFFSLFYSQLALTRLLLTAGCAVTCHRAMLCIKSRISHIGKDPLSNISVYPVSSHPIRFPPRLSAQVEGRNSDRFGERSVRRISFPCAAEPPLPPPPPVLQPRTPLRWAEVKCLNFKIKAKHKAPPS